MLVGCNNGGQVVDRVINEFLLKSKDESKDL